MTTPNVERRFEHRVEVPGTPEQVWAAIATAQGISSWMMRTELEEREGGRVAFHMGPDMASEGTVTAWDPPRRIVYEEDWAALAEQDPDTVTPLVTEFIVEASSGGTCVVRVVTSAFGTGAEWEADFFEGMAKGWTPMFDHLRLYLTHFAGQPVTTMEAYAETTMSTTEAIAVARRALGVTDVGQTVDALGTKAEVERVADETFILRLTDPVPGIVNVFAWAGPEGGSVTLRMGGYLFGPDAATHAAEQEPAWKAGLESLTT